jgi:phenylalanyl-tRNA synthetase beta chain
VKEKQISLSWEKLNRIAGIDVPRPVAIKILESLSFVMLATDETQTVVAAPTFKSDVACSEDVIEEVLRIYGYDKIPVPEAVRSSLSFSVGEKKEAITEELSHMLVAMGFSEMINNSISNSKYPEEFFPGTKESVVRLLSYSNAGLDSLRTSMLFPALEVVLYNHNRKQHNLKLFEFGKTYVKEKTGYVESSHLILLMSGSWLEESWREKQVPADFYFMKGVVENILKKSGIQNFQTEAVANEIWEEGLEYRVGQTKLVSFGRVRQKIAASFDIKKEVYYAEMNGDALLKHASNEIAFTSLPKFPSVRRDIALVVDQHISFGDIEELAYKSCKNMLKEVNLFDVYADEKIGADKKSYAVSFLFLDEKKTLTDEEVDQLIAKLTHQFQSQLNAHIRT